MNIDKDKLREGILRLEELNNPETKEDCIINNIYMILIMLLVENDENPTKCKNAMIQSMLYYLKSECNISIENINKRLNQFGKILGINIQIQEIQVDNALMI